MTDKLTLLLSKIEAVASKASPLPWPKDFARIDDYDAGCAAIGPIIRNDDEDAEDAQAQADQDFIVLSRSVILNLVEVAQAAANIRGTGSYRLNNALAKLEEFYAVGPASTKLGEVDCP